jgi:hypothetical protein
MIVITWQGFILKNGLIKIDTILLPKLCTIMSLNIVLAYTCKNMVVITHNYFCCTLDYAFTPKEYDYLWIGFFKFDILINGYQFGYKFN